MRFTQFGHQVPRRNSRISVPWASKPARVNVPSRLAAPKEKSGARAPISRVSVRFFMLSSTVSEVDFRNNNGWGTGMVRDESIGQCPSAQTRFFHVRYNFSSQAGDAASRVSTIATTFLNSSTKKRTHRSEERRVGKE